MDESATIGIGFVGGHPLRHRTVKSRHTASVYFWGSSHIREPWRHLIQSQSAVYSSQQGLEAEPADSGEAVAGPASEVVDGGKDPAPAVLDQDRNSVVLCVHHP